MIKKSLLFSILTKQTLFFVRDGVFLRFDSTQYVKIHFLRKKIGGYVTGRPDGSGPSRQEVKNDVWKYLQTIVICL